MRTPSRASISARRRGIVQLRRSATGCSSKGMATRKAASLFTGGGPGATLVFSAATPSTAKSLRHRRTVSSRTPNASAILELVQPANVKSTARARSASPRSRHLARAKRPARCSSLAVTGDFPAMPYTLRIGASSEPQKTYPLVSRRELLSVVFTEWCRSFEALPSRMRDSGRDRDPAGCEVSRGSPAGKRAHLGSASAENY